VLAKHTNALDRVTTIRAVTVETSLMELEAKNDNFGIINAFLPDGDLRRSCVGSVRPVSAHQYIELTVFPPDGKSHDDALNSKSSWDFKVACFHFVNFGYQVEMVGENIMQLYAFGGRGNREFGYFTYARPPGYVPPSGRTSWKNKSAFPRIRVGRLMRNSPGAFGKKGYAVGQEAYELWSTHFSKDSTKLEKLKVHTHGFWPTNSPTSGLPSEGEQRRMPVLNSNINQLSKQLEAKDTKIRSLEQELENAKMTGDTLGEVLKKLAAKDYEANQASEKVKSLQSELDSMTEILHTKEASLLEAVEAKEASDKYKRKFHALEITFQGNKNANCELRKQVSDAKVEFKEAKETWTKNVQTRVVTIQDLRQRLKTLEEEHNLKIELSDKADANAQIEKRRADDANALVTQLGVELEQVRSQVSQQASVSDKAASGELATLSAELRLKEKKLEDASVRVATLDQRVAELELQKTSDAEVVQELQNKVRKLEEENTKLKGDREDSQKTLRDKQQQLKHALSLIGSLSGENKQKQLEIALSLVRGLGGTVKHRRTGNADDGDEQLAKKIKQEAEDNT
jgi:hypothetical protein